MKYLALLRDSFREAMDNKVLYATITLSALLILLLLSLHFQPMTARDQAESVAEFLNFFIGTQTQFDQKSPKVDVAQCEQLNDAPEPWNGNYRIVMRLQIPKDSDSNKVFLFRALLDNQIREKFWWMDNRTIKTKESDDGREVTFTITNDGTRITDPVSWTHDPSLFFGYLPLSKIPLFGTMFQTSLTYSVYWIERVPVNNIGGWVIVLIGVIVTASFIPNMMEKGSIDLLLVKPISRPMLLIGKYFGGLTFVFINSLIAIGGAWLAIGFRTGIWSYSFLLTVVIISFFFAILYAVSTLLGVLTRNSLLAILGTCLTWLILFMIGWIYGIFNPTELTGQQYAAAKKLERALSKQNEQAQSMAVEQSPLLSGIKSTIEVLHTVLPRTDDLGNMTTVLLTEELLTEEEKKEYSAAPKEPINWLESIGVSLAFIVVVLGIATWRFSVRDY